MIAWYQYDSLESENRIAEIPEPWIWAQLDYCIIYYGSTSRGRLFRRDIYFLCIQWEWNWCPVESIFFCPAAENIKQKCRIRCTCNIFTNKYPRLLSQVFVHLRRIWRVVKPVRPLLALDTWMGQRKSGFGTAVLWKQSRSFSHSHSQ